MGKLYQDQQHKSGASKSFCQHGGTRILKSEVEYAIKQLMTNKSPRSDEIYPEILKLISEDNIDLFVDLFNRIYQTRKIHGEWLE